ncbi:MAG: WD40 repeat domain-containing protein [Deltaproteobacteria bacterium]|nr:WD40 repeat domain-containing protein [Deltaproteobacteria bacterium]
MKQIANWTAALGAVALAVGMASCGDSDEPEKAQTGPATETGLKCGKGTHEDKGFCVADAQNSAVETPVFQAPPSGYDAGVGWETQFARKTGVTLEATADSSGDPTWDPAAHPLVFITTVGPGYGGALGGVKLPGYTVIDAATHEVLVYRAFDLKWADPFEPHGLGVSPDGKWIYLPTGDGPTRGRFLIINAKTGKLDKMLATRGRPHHASAFTDSKGNGRALLYGWAQPPFVLDPKDDNKVVGGMDFTDLGMEGYLYFIDPTGKEMWASGRWRQDVASELKDNIVMVADAEAWKLKKMLPIHDSTPVWIDFSADNRWAYASGGHSSVIVKYDRATYKEIGESRAGVEGPYGLRLSWDGKIIYAVGKGEGSHNQGKEIGLVDTMIMETTDRPMNVFPTDCIRGDHATLHPVSSTNELWLSCNSSFKVAIYDMKTNTVSGSIPMPSGGSTHSGAFVKYNADWTGEVLSDHNGLHGAPLKEQAALHAKVGVKTP